MLPTAGVPFLEHLLSRIREAGIEHVVLGTSYKAEVFSEYFGDGSAFGLDIEYVVETEPLGTGGGIRNVADKLRHDTQVVFNGDVLSGMDLGALMDTHFTRDADVTLHLMQVADPRAFGCVPTDADGWVTDFLEKTENPPTNQINAGCYVFKRSVLEAIPAGRPVSVERDTFPGLLAAGAKVAGYVDSSYWLDLGTPAAFVQGSADLVRGIAPTYRPGRRTRRPAGPRRRDRRPDGDAGRWHRHRCGCDASGRCPGSTAAVVFDGATIGEGVHIERCIIGRDAVIGDGSVLADAVIGDRAVIGARCELIQGVRVWPDVQLPAAGVRFSADA